MENYNESFDDYRNILNVRICVNPEFWFGESQSLSIIKSILKTLIYRENTRVGESKQHFLF